MFKAPPHLGSFNPRDVTVLMSKHTIRTTPTREKEERIQSGQHYATMLSDEPTPSNAYLHATHPTRTPPSVITGTLAVSNAIQALTPHHAVLVSLARAGTLPGIVIKRTLEHYGTPATHYTVSIIRDYGLDPRAAAFILERHDPRDITFVDGWTGKGVIHRELQASWRAMTGHDAVLAVLHDPAGVATIAGMHADALLPSGLLGATAAGLLSRTFLPPEPDFHAVTQFEYLHAFDMTNDILESWWASVLAHGPLDVIEGVVPRHVTASESVQAVAAATVERIMRSFTVTDVNRVKVGVMEATRALLRRSSVTLLVPDTTVAHVQPALVLAAERRVPVIPFDTSPYTLAAVIGNAA